MNLKFQESKAVINTVSFVNEAIRTHKKGG